jgi:AcrR family transcriptional regulator
MTRPTRVSSGDDTRSRLMRAAEQLFAARGIEGVSLREINRAAGQSNTGAVQYHFGDREGLLRGVIERHRRDTEPRRHALLDQYEEAGVDDLRTLAAALVLPLAAKLADPDGGRAYLQIAAEFYGRPASLDELIGRRQAGASMERWNRLLDPLLVLTKREPLSPRSATIRFAFVELARRAAFPPRPDDRLFVSHLTDLVAALLRTEPSEQTLRMLEQREPRRPNTSA